MNFHCTPIAFFIEPDNEFEIRLKAETNEVLFRLNIIYATNKTDNVILYYKGGKANAEAPLKLRESGSGDDSVQSVDEAEDIRNIRKCK